MLTAALSQLPWGMRLVTPREGTGFISAFFFSKPAGLSDWRENVLHILAIYSEPFMEGSPSLQTLLSLCKLLLW